MLACKREDPTGEIDTLFISGRVPPIFIFASAKTLFISFLLPLSYPCGDDNHVYIIHHTLFLPCNPYMLCQDRREREK